MVLRPRVRAHRFTRASAWIYDLAGDTAQMDLIIYVS